MDKRIQRTRKLLGTALIDLLQDQPFHQITIRQITEQASVAYSTFFRNFDNVEDLLLSYLRDLLRELKQRTRYAKGNTLKELSRGKVTLVLEHVRENEDKYRILLGTPVLQPTIKAFQQELANDNLVMLQPYNAQLVTTIPPLDLIVKNSIAQLFSLIEWWLDHDLEPDISIVVLYHEQLITIPMWQLLFGEEQAIQYLNKQLPGG